MQESESVATVNLMKIEKEWNELIGAFKMSSMWHNKWKKIAFDVNYYASEFYGIWQSNFSSLFAFLLFCLRFSIQPHNERIA